MLRSLSVGNAGCCKRCGYADDIEQRAIEKREMQIEIEQQLADMVEGENK